MDDEQEEDEEEEEERYAGGLFFAALTILAALRLYAAPAGWAVTAMGLVTWLVTRLLRAAWLDVGVAGVETRLISRAPA